jgi:hypothetical protein
MPAATVARTIKPCVEDKGLLHLMAGFETIALYKRAVRTHSRGVESSILIRVVVTLPGACLLQLLRA